MGSRAVEEAAQEVYVYFGLANSLSATALAEGFNQEEWDRLIKFGLDIQTEFTTSARGDLGLPRRQRHLPRIERTESASEYLKITLDTASSFPPSAFGPVATGDDEGTTPSPDAPPG